MISISVASEKTIAWIKQLPRGIKFQAMKAYTEYIVGNDRRGLKHAPPQKFVRRSVAYGQQPPAQGEDTPPPAGYFSWRQFRFVAKITDGFTKQYQRTNKIVSAWTVKAEDSDWRRVRVENQANGAGWVFGEQQARQIGLVGWRKYLQVAQDNAKGAYNAAVQAVVRWLKTKQ